MRITGIASRRNSLKFTPAQFVTEGHDQLKSCYKTSHNNMVTALISRSLTFDGSFSQFVGANVPGGQSFTWIGLILQGFLELVV